MNSSFFQNKNNATGTSIPANQSQIMNIFGNNQKQPQQFLPQPNQHPPPPHPSYPPNLVPAMTTAQYNHKKQMLQPPISEQE